MSSLKEYKLAWYHANKARTNPLRRERNRAYMQGYAARPEAKAAAAARKVTKRDQYAETMRAWREKNRESIRNHNRNRQAITRGALAAEHVTEQQWAELLETFGHVCAYCLRPGKLECDHFRPLKSGGERRLENIVPACRKCNARKHGGLVFDFVPRII